MSTPDIRNMFDPAQFRLQGHALIDLLASYLEQALQGKGAVLDWRPPAEEIRNWQEPLPQQPALTPQGFLLRLRQDVLADSLHIHHPRNLGHQVAPPLPLAALCDLVAALTNQAMAVYETGPSATMLERQVLQWLGDLIGWQGCSGVLTSGGAQANLTALLAARQCMAGWNAWREGVAAGPGLRLLASENAHYSVSRAAGIMGLGTDAVIPIRTDRDGCMDVAALEAAWQACVARGEKPFAAVATAGTTPTGSIDPLNEVGAFCRAHDLWFHVDGAHGASALLSRRHRDKLAGIELADSVVWDGHKLLYMPATVSAVLFRDPENSYAAFAQEASYLFQGENQKDEAWNTSYRTLECTKRMMGLKLWAAFSLYGVEGLATLVDEVFAKAELFAGKLTAHPDFELLMQPQTNIVCFRRRMLDSEGDTSDRCQAEIRRKIVQSGAFHLTQVELQGQLWLRTTLMHPFTQAEDLEALMAMILQPSTY